MSRTAKSIKNSKVALLYSVATFVVGFFSRKVFLEYLGAELLGLNTTAVNLLQFLNLAEMGIGTAIACTLYKPLFDKDEKTINEIISLQGWLYRNIAYIVIAASAILMCFFPLIFAKSTLPLWYAYATFTVLLFGALLSYFVNYKQIILSANQEQYKIIYSFNFVKTIKFVFQIVAILSFKNGYIWWLVIEFLFSIISSVTLNTTIKKTAPLLKADVKEGYLQRKKYPEIITKVKQLFAHKIAGFVLVQTQPLIIYAFASLTLVAYYGNYMFIIMGMTTLTWALFNGMAASVGNLIAEGDYDRIMRVFDELYTSRFFFISSLVVWAYVISPQFITLWVGSEYIMKDSTVILMLLAFFIQGTRTTVDEYISAHGMFQDVWAPITEAILNLGCSILLGYYFGINGVLLGSIISLVIIVLCWKPYFLFTKGLKEPITKYIKIFVSNVLILTLIVVAIYIFDFRGINISIGGRYLNFILNSAISFAVISIVIFSFQYAISQGMRDFTNRIKRLIK